MYLCSRNVRYVKAHAPYVPPLDYHVTFARFRLLFAACAWVAAPVVAGSVQHSLRNTWVSIRLDINYPSFTTVVWPPCYSLIVTACIHTVIFFAIILIASQLGYVVISIAAIVILFVTGRHIITDYSTLRAGRDLYRRG